MSAHGRVDTEAEALRWLADALGWSLEDLEAPVASGSRLLPFSVLPNARRPKALVPAGGRRVAGAALRSFNDSMSHPARIGRAALGAVIRFGLDGLLRLDRAAFSSPLGAPSPSLLEYLERVVGRPVEVAVSLVPVARPNRKPVLQVLDAGGRRIGFAKIGWNDLTKRLVDDEAAALTAIGGAGLRTLEIPRLLHAGTWEDRTVVLVSPGPAPLVRRCRRNAPAPLAAEREVAATRWVERGSVDGSTYLADLRRRVNAGPVDPRLAARTQAVLDRLADDPTPLTFGAWHGDWAPWNMSRTSRTLFVWDWERYGGPVPEGFDRFHLQFQLQNLVRSAPVPVAAARASVALSETVGARAARPVRSLYLIERVVRLEEGRAAGIPVRAGVVDAIVDLLEADHP
jgi:hypothetical protein